MKMLQTLIEDVAESLDAEPPGLREEGGKHKVGCRVPKWNVYLLVLVAEKTGRTVSAVASDLLAAASEDAVTELLPKLGFTTEAELEEGFGAWVRAGGRVEAGEGE
jgi:hypothetical protein